MAMGFFRRSEALSREPAIDGPATDDPSVECAHLSLRPGPESGGYLCDACHRELTTVEAEEASSEAAVRALSTRCCLVPGPDACPTVTRAVPSRARAR